MLGYRSKDLLNIEKLKATLLFIERAHPNGQNREMFCLAPCPIKICTNLEEHLRHQGGPLTSLMIAIDYHMGVDSIHALSSDRGHTLPCAIAKSST